MTGIWRFTTALHVFTNIYIGYRTKVYSDIRYNVGLWALQSDIGRSDIRLSPILLITDIGPSAHLCPVLSWKIVCAAWAPVSGWVGVSVCQEPLLSFRKTISPIWLRSSLPPHASLYNLPLLLPMVDGCFVLNNQRWASLTQNLTSYSLKR